MGEEPALAPAELQSLLDDSLARNLGALAEAGVQVVREYGPPLRVFADPPRLTEAFSELVTNARRAMPKGGKLTVGYRSVEGRVSVPDLHATPLHQLGLDHEKLTYRHHGSDETLTDARVTKARVVTDILSGSA